MKLVVALIAVAIALGPLGCSRPNPNLDARLDALEGRIAKLEDVAGKLFQLTEIAQKKSEALQVLITVSSEKIAALEAGGADTRQNLGEALKLTSQQASIIAEANRKQVEILTQELQRQREAISLLNAQMELAARMRSR